MLHRPRSYHEYRKVGAVQVDTFIRSGILNIIHTGYGSVAPQRFMNARLLGRTTTARQQRPAYPQ